MLTRNDLHKYQVACVKHIISHPFCGLFLDMGLGKTVSTLTAISDLKYDYCEISRTLVIAPKRVAETVWAEEAQKWSHLKHLTFSKVIGTERQRMEALEKKADIYIISRDNVAWLCAKYAAALPFDACVIDELSSFKSYKSQRFKSLRLSRPFMKRVIGLTGTPAPNSLIDLWPQVYLLDRGQRLEKTISAYRSKYFRPGQSNGYVVFNYKIIEGAVDAIHNKISDICISMKAEDYIEMPLKTDNFIELRMPDDLAKRYDKFEKDNIMKMIDENGNSIEINAANAAALSNKLLQFANGAVYDEDQCVHAIHDLKLDALKEIIEDANGQSVLVAWTFRFDRDRIMEYLRPYSPRELKTPQDIEDWNEGKIRVMIAHPASAGHGLNLQAGGNIIVWFGQTWSLELYQQFNARLYRQGQTKNIIIHHLITKGTHDEDVVKALAAKDKGQTRLLNSIKAKINDYITSMRQQ